MSGTFGGEGRFPSVWREPTLRFFLAFFALIGHPSQTAAQGEYHWSDQFGNKSTLLNGTVIAGVSDLGAVFYNPGRLAQILRPEFLLTAEAFEMTQVEAMAGTGEKDQIEQVKIRGLPSLVSGVFTLPSLPGHRFAYSFLTRRHSDSNLLSTSKEEGDFYPDIPGQEIYLGSWETVSKLDEKWVGITWARPISPRVSLGLSTFMTYRGRTRRVETNDRVVTGGGEASVVSRFREYRFSSYGLVWKGGVAVERNGFRVGLTATTPEITPLGSGSVRYEDLFVRPGTPGAGSPADVAVLFHEKGLKTRTHSPISLGAGVSWIISRGEIHLGGEWYSGVSRYRVLGADSIPGPISGEAYAYEVVDELKPVFNIGLGIEWQVSQALSAYGSLIRDASAASGDLPSPFSFESQVGSSIFNGDGFHAGGGLSVESRWVHLTAGATYGEVRGKMERPFGSATMDSGLGVPELEEIRTLRRRWRFLLGFSIPLVRGTSLEGGGRERSNGSSPAPHTARGNSQRFTVRERPQTEPEDVKGPEWPHAGDDALLPGTFGCPGPAPARRAR
jgi:hypothetical protein